MSVVRRAGPTTAFLAVLVGAWELYVRARGVAGYVLPPPSRVARELSAMSGDLGPHVRFTLTGAVAGLVIGAAAGVALALAIASWAFARRAVYPLLIAFQGVPALVLAPLFSVWLGYGYLPKIVLVALVGFFPVVVSTVDGLVGSDRERVELVRSFGGTKRQVLRLVRVPEALPAFFAGLKIAASYAVIAAVIAEWMGTSEGLGLVMTRAQRSFRMDRVFATVVVVAAASLALFALVALVARLATPWTASDRDEGSLA